DAHQHAGASGRIRGLVVRNLRVRLECLRVLLLTLPAPPEAEASFWRPRAIREPAEGLSVRSPALLPFFQSSENLTQPHEGPVADAPHILKRFLIAEEG